jgi:hypothetical protein
LRLKRHHNTVRGRARISAITRHPQDYPFRAHGVLIFGALAATLLGVLTALQLDLVIAFVARLMHPVGQEALMRSTATAGLTGLLCWVVCALVTRAISRSALKPYNALADHFERLADGEAEGPIDSRRPQAGVRRLARAVVVFHQRALASERAEADLQVRYERLCHEQADERRLIMGLIMDRRPGERSPSDLPALDSPALTVFDIPKPSPAREAPDVWTPDSGQVVDLTGRLRPPARRVEERSVFLTHIPDLTSLDFALVRR